MVVKGGMLLQPSRCFPNGLYSLMPKRRPPVNPRFGATFIISCAAPGYLATLDCTVGVIVPAGDIINLRHTTLEALSGMWNRVVDYTLTKICLTRFVSSCMRRNSKTESASGSVELLPRPVIRLLTLLTYCLVRR